MQHVQTDATIDASLEDGASYAAEPARQTRRSEVLAVKMPKATDEDKERFQCLVPEDPAVEVKPMFGNLGAFVNGNMFMGLFGSSVGLKLPDDDQARLLAEPSTGPFGPDERPMRGYVALPQGWSPREAAPWTARALSHAAALPPRRKAAKP